MVEVTQFRLCFYERLDSLDRALDGSGELINILWLDDSLEVIFEHFGKVVYFELVGYFWT